jgi:FADH2-dependent halogenase
MTVTSSSPAPSPIRPDYDVDVAVIGGGPAGSIAALTLAQQGRSVLVLERRDFPRFHIGESMTPYMITVFERLGIADALIAMGYPVKHGAEFIFPDGGYWRVPLAGQGDGRLPWTVQVERASFDKLLVDQAAAAGADVRMNANVLDVLEDETGRVTGLVYEADGESHEVRARYVIDAGGRASRIAARYGLRQWIPQLRSVAVFGHHTGLDDARGPHTEGDIQVAGHRDGWVWAIPTGDDTLSVGAVMSKETFESLRGRPLPDVYADHVGRTDRVVTRMAGTTQRGGLQVDSDYGYYSDTLAGPGWFLVGDAGCFVDPIFSGGVWLATATAWIAAQRIDAMLDKPERENEIVEEYQRFCKTGYDMYARMTFAFYGAFTSGSESVMSTRLKGLGIDVNGIEFSKLIGGDFWDAGNTPGQIMRSNPEWHFFAPFERTDYCPVYGR